MARNRRAPYRGVIFGPAVVAGPVACWYLHDPGGRLGAVALTAAGVVVVPVVMLAVITTPLALVKAAVPRGWRHWWRRGGHWWRRSAVKHPRPKVLLARMVRAADRDRCVGCGIRQAELQARSQVLAAATGAPQRKLSLQLDHCFPFGDGGLLILWNLFLLCPSCNEIKSNYWKYRSGKVTYRPFAGRGDRGEAARILRRERLRRFSVLRWWRAAWVL
jgi:5-methylcytosine-specific restriction endonuclease McrA